MHAEVLRGLCEVGPPLRRLICVLEVDRVEACEGFQAWPLACFVLGVIKRDVALVAGQDGGHVAVVPCGDGGCVEAQPCDRSLNDGAKQAIEAVFNRAWRLGCFHVGPPWGVPPVVQALGLNRGGWKQIGRYHRGQSRPEPTQTSARPASVEKRKAPHLQGLREVAGAGFEPATSGL